MLIFPFEHSKFVYTGLPNQTGRITNQHFLLCAITKLTDAFKLE